MSGPGIYLFFTGILIFLVGIVLLVALPSNERHWWMYLLIVFGAILIVWGAVLWLVIGVVTTTSTNPDGSSSTQLNPLLLEAALA